MGGVVPEAQPVEAILDAMRTRDAGAALVAVADAVDAGRDPRTLGEVLIERLREAFLAVMGAPDRHLPSADLEKAAALGGELGPAGLTRALEVLGEALVELAKKPDPRIVLEVALVRLCRPDADRSLEAVLERLERLERAVASGGPAPTPPASGESAAGPASASGPASGAREELARVTGSQARTPRAPAKKATATTAAAPPRAAAASSAPDEAVASPVADEAPMPAVAELMTAWPGVVSGLRGGAKSLYLGAQFVSVEGGAASLAFENEPTRSHCEKHRGQVEAALAAHFGRAVPLRLVVRDLPAALPAASSTAGADDEAEVEIVDVHALDDAPAAGSGVDRLTEAFPGAELVEEQ
jgi:DNA polymerase-3 subunit gamma/tau